MKWNVGTKIATGFGLVLVIFILVGAASYRATSQLIAASDLRRQSLFLMDQLDEPLPLLNDMELGNRNYYLTGDERFAQQARAARERIAPALAQLRKLTADHPGLQGALDELESHVRERLAYSSETLAVYKSQGQKGVVEQLKDRRAVALNEAVVKSIGQMKADQGAVLAERVQEADRNGLDAKATILLGTLGAVAMALLAGVLITRNISRPLRDLTAFAERITVGDIRVRLPVDGRGDEVGLLARAFDRMAQYLQTMAQAAEQMAGGDLRKAVTPQSPDDVLGNAFVRMTGNLREQLGGMVDAAQVLAASASEIVASTAQLAASASESAAAVAETTTTVEEVRQTAQVASQKARHVSDSAERAVQSAVSGRKSADDVGAGMDRIRQQMEAIAASMGRLSEHSQTIGQIIATVEDLAVQSNLLAVNAAIEAAKAGDHGKGFGVVAQEVKSLASQSRQATNQVRNILGDVQTATVSAVMATAQGSEAVAAGSRQSGIASDSILALSASINESAQAATQIAVSSQQQLVGVDQVAGAMESIGQASRQNLVSAKQLETAARNLDDLGRRFKQIVAGYSL